MQLDNNIKYSSGHIIIIIITIMRNLCHNVVVNKNTLSSYCTYRKVFNC